MLNVSMADPEHNLRPRLTVVGVGGAGGNAINNMIRCGLEGCDFIGANTDSQALSLSLAQRKIQLGVNLSRGLGAGSKPDIGRAAAEEQINDILSCLDGSDMIFITAGMGGGTGTGAAPVIARAARESGILTVGVVTKPFHFEGSSRMRQAEAGIAELQQYVDTLIVIPNQNLFRIANERTTFAEAFRLADEVLLSGVRGITDLMVMPGFMNLDFADVKTVMGEMGKAMMGTGEAEGENRAILAAEAAISNPLLDDVSMKGARGVLINITGGLDMTLFEVDQAANRIREEVDSEAQIKVGSTLGENMEGRMRVSVIATGIDVVTTSSQRSSSSDTSAIRVKAPVEVKTSQPPQKETTLATNFGQQTSYFTAPATTQIPTQKSASPTRTLKEQDPGTEETGDIREPSVSHGVTETTQAPSAQAPVTAAPKFTTGYTQRTITQSTMPPVTQKIVPPMGTSSPVAAKVAPKATPPSFEVRTQASNTQSDLLSEQRRARRTESLFTRITGFGMVRPSSQKDDVMGSYEEEAPETMMSTQDPAAPAQTPDANQETSDLLDIPAFLRRQTNH